MNEFAKDFMRDVARGELIPRVGIGAKLTAYRAEPALLVGVEIVLPREKPGLKARADFGAALF